VTLRVTIRAARSRVLALGLAGLVLLSTALTCSARADDGAGEPLFRLRDSRIVESSSLVVSTTEPGLAYTANDGPTPRVYAIDTRTGRTLGTTDIAGVVASDIEAMAPGPGGALYVGDIGDNDAARSDIRVFRIAEPQRGRTATRAVTYRLRYPDGAHDAEALLVAPSGRLIVVSKELLGGTVYAAPRRLVPGSVSDLRPLAAAPSLVTDGAVLAGGRLAVLRTYAAAPTYRLPGWQRVLSWPLPSQRQGESLAAGPEATTLLVGSEGSASPVFTAAVPASAVLAAVVPRRLSTALRAVVAAVLGVLLTRD